MREARSEILPKSCSRPHVSRLTCHDAARKPPPPLQRPSAGCETAGPTPGPGSTLDCRPPSSPSPKAHGQHAQVTRPVSYHINTTYQLARTRRFCSCHQTRPDHQALYEWIIGFGSFTQVDRQMHTAVGRFRVYMAIPYRHEPHQKQVSLPVKLLRHTTAQQAAPSNAASSYHQHIEHFSLSAFLMLALQEARSLILPLGKSTMRRERWVADIGWMSHFCAHVR